MIRRGTTHGQAREADQQDDIGHLLNGFAHGGILKIGMGAVRRHDLVLVVPRGVIPSRPVSCHRTAFPV